MVDVFDRHGVRFDPHLAGCSRFVRYSDYAALEAQLAEVKAERDEYKRLLDSALKAGERAQRLLARSLSLP